jgi:hypothetical protein
MDNDDIQIEFDIIDEYNENQYIVELLDLFV